ncbi:predicted protein [Uncinocarpus reesii 1704]|uniref:Aminoglycoside phosphotransferase domain-containing protein n=1 Tax=Uncinocarpus reesii (strain UAMH 1704) TaxID=336963 RepID=C4JIP0_UNCRE|nr:uncharacterized protein UREG_02901 [Uncinocarpus reesii 1704]EEP78052.1 predicted protein [Uncinocarpus reesii 1704]
MRVRMCFDDLAWEQSENVSDAWISSLFKEETLMAIGRFILRHRKGTPVELCDPKAGAFNASFRMTFEDGGSALIRFPKPGATMFPEEKSLGPFIIMEYIDHAMSMSEALNTPGFAVEDRPILNPRIDEEKLKMLYGQAADILLQLSTLSLPKIGSLSQIDDFTWEVTRRPLSINMNELVRVGSLPRSKLPKPAATFGTASAYFSALADLHLDHLIHQRNDAVDSETDCRRKYTARTLFSQLIAEGRLTTTPTNNGPFKLWCDDLRPSNILVNENMQILGVVDWEFTYAAPVEFSHAPPCRNIGRRALREQEDVALGRGTLKHNQRLSVPMKQSWENGGFWAVYAARKNFAFDTVFWKKLDERYLGPRMSNDEDVWRERIELLSKEDRETMDQVVQRKLDEMKDRILAWEADEVVEPDASGHYGRDGSLIPAIEKMFWFLALSGRTFNGLLDLSSDENFYKVELPKVDEMNPRSVSSSLHQVEQHDIVVRYGGGMLSNREPLTSLGARVKLAVLT